MAVYFHGTTQQGLNAILSNAGKPTGPWNCADQDRLTYLWDSAAMVEGEDFDDSEGVIRQAFESAQIQAAIVGEDNRLFVLEINLPAESVEPDWSCENMHYAVTISELALKVSDIARVYVCEFSKWDSPFVLSGLIGREHFADCNVKDERLVLLAKSLQSQDVFREEIFEFEWVEVPLEDAGITTRKAA